MTDTLQINLSEDAYLGNAKFSVTVDGISVGGIQTVTTSHSSGLTEAFEYTGNWGVGAHKVVVTFLNDAYAGKPTADRNLYVKSASFDGSTYSNINDALLSTGSTGTFYVQAPTSIIPAGSFKYFGVNLSGAEWGTKFPGTYNVDYTYPTHAEIDYFASKGMDTIRLPFSWERVQPTEDGPLNTAQLGYIDNIVSYAATKGVTVDLDVHNYGIGYGNIVGSAGTPDSAFSNLWSQLATHFKADSNVLFGLMNEPHEQTASQWETAAQGAINAIRATGAGQEILVSGTAWDGALSWVSSGNASALGAITDPLKNFAFEVHQYLDPNGSGSDWTTPISNSQLGVERLTDITNWAKETGSKLFLGEFGVPPDAQSLTAESNMLTYMKQNTDVWQGATAWAAGPWWGSSFRGTVEPTGTVGHYTDAPAMSVLSKFVA